MRTLINLIRSKNAEIFKIAMAVIAMLLIVNAFPKRGTFKYEFYKGKPWAHENLIAPFDFAISKSNDEINAEQQQILKNEKLYFVIDTTVFDNVRDLYNVSFNDNWDNFKNNGNDQLRQQYYKRGLEILKTIYLKGILQRNELIENKPDNYSIVLVKNNIAEEQDIKDFYSVLTAYQYIQYCLDTRNTDDFFLSDLLENLIKQNVHYDPETTKKVRSISIEKISLNRDMKQQGERIISTGELIDDEKFQILQSLKQEFLLKMGNGKGLNYIGLGQFLLVSICILMLAIFVILFRKDLISDQKKVLFLLFSVALVSIMAAVAIRLNIVSIYMLPFCILPVIIRSFFDSRLALFTHITTILIVSLIAPNPYEFVFIQVVVGIFATFSIIDMRNRSQLFISVLIIGISYCIIFLGITLVNEGNLNSIEWRVMAWFGVSSLLTLFAYPLIYIYEKIFGFISDVTLMELVDINRPLLRELALIAPGTFQHSLEVANLAEEAIYAIGGSSLLIRAGALYHDIGKMENPMYFIENQYSGTNPHHSISNEESTNIIISHVNNGLEIAKRNRLPEQVKDFIRTHHGTTKVEYFYRTYVNEHPNENVETHKFEYPGPMPFSKETAVLMMADSVEATSRSLKKYDKEIIENLVDDVVDNLVAQNQFINSDITFKNIDSIKKIFKKKLTVMYHLRIEYPQLKK